MSNIHVIIINIQSELYLIVLSLMLIVLNITILRSLHPQLLILASKYIGILNIAILLRTLLNIKFHLAQILYKASLGSVNYRLAMPRTQTNIHLDVVYYLVQSNIVIFRSHLDLLQVVTVFLNVPILVSQMHQQLACIFLSILHTWVLRLDHLLIEHSSLLLPQILKTIVSVFSYLFQIQLLILLTLFLHLRLVDSADRMGPAEEEGQLKGKTCIFLLEEKLHDIGQYIFLIQKELLLLIYFFVLPLILQLLFSIVAINSINAIGWDEIHERLL